MQPMTHAMRAKGAVDISIKRAKLCREHDAAKYSLPLASYEHDDDVWRHICGGVATTTTPTTTTRPKDPVDLKYRALINKYSSINNVHNLVLWFSHFKLHDKVFRPTHMHRCAHVLNSIKHTSATHQSQHYPPLPVRNNLRDDSRRHGRVKRCPKPSWKEHRPRQKYHSPPTNTCLDQHETLFTLSALALLCVTFDTALKHCLLENTAPPT